MIPCEPSMPYGLYRTCRVEGKGRALLHPHYLVLVVFRASNREEMKKGSGKGVRGLEGGAWENGKAPKIVNNFESCACDRTWRSLLPALQIIRSLPPSPHLPCLYTSTPLPGHGRFSLVSYIPANSPSNKPATASALHASGTQTPQLSGICWAEEFFCKKAHSFQ